MKIGANHKDREARTDDGDNDHQQNGDEQNLSTATSARRTAALRMRHNREFPLSKTTKWPP